MDPEWNHSQVRAYLNHAIRSARRERAPYRLGETRFACNLVELLASRYWRQALARVVTAAMVGEVFTGRTPAGLILATHCATETDALVVPSLADLPGEYEGVVVITEIWSDTPTWPDPHPDKAQVQGYSLVSLTTGATAGSDTQIPVRHAWTIDELRRPEP